MKNRVDDGKYFISLTKLEVASSLCVMMSKAMKYACEYSLTLEGIAEVLSKHAVSRYIACNVSPTDPPLAEGPPADPGGARYFSRYGCFLSESKNHGSARKSPVCSTAPLGPSIRNLQITYERPFTGRKVLPT